MIRESLDQAPRGSQPNLDLALPRVSLTTKPLTENQITYLAKIVACLGPDAVETVRDLEVDGNMADSGVPGVSRRWTPGNDRYVTSAGQQPLDDDKAKTTRPSNHDGVLGAH
jgi:hypothetical protein